MLFGSFSCFTVIRYHLMTPSFTISAAMGNIAGSPGHHNIFKPKSAEIRS